MMVVLFGKLDAAGTLGLVLHYLTLTMLDVSLMQYLQSFLTVARYLNFSLNILLKTLVEMPDASV